MDTRWLLAVRMMILLTMSTLQTSARWLEGHRVTLASWSSSRGAALHSLTHNYTHADSDARMDYVRRPDTMSGGRFHTLEEDLSLLVLDQRTGRAMIRRNFRTSEEFSWWADLVWWLQRVSPGRLVVITVTGRSTLGLRHARTLFAELGSAFALYLAQQTAWTWAFVKGGHTIYESLLKGNRNTEITLAFQDVNDSIYAEGTINLSTELLPTIKNDKDEERWHYCHLHAAMGGLCDEHTPDPLPPPPPPTLQHQSALADVPVVVTAGARHQYLYHTLNTLLTAPGAQRNNVLVVLGDAPQPTTQLLRLINVNFTKVPVHGEGNLKLFRYYRSVFQLVARTFPDAPAVIFLDEDVEVSPDFFSFMSQTLWLLREDPTLYCINGFSATGFEGRAFNESQVFRGSVQVEWGYAVSLDFVREALASWVDEVNAHFYDFWLYNYVRKNRECVFPEVSRTRHFGMGTNTVPYLKEPVIRMPLQREAPIILRGVSTLKLPSWQKYISQEIKDATVLTGNPCRDDFLPSPLPARSYVFYYRLDRTPAGQSDIHQYHNAAMCVGLWSLSDQGHHRGVSVVRFSPNSTLYLLGVPYSHYSHLYTKNTALWNVDLLSDQQLTQMTNYTLEQESMKEYIRNINMTAEYLSELLAAIK